mgnify:FL=1
MSAITLHFKSTEFDCKDGTAYPEEWYPRLVTLCVCLEQIRHELGGKPITVISGYRTKPYNERCGGSKKSQHLEGIAVDIRVKGVSPQEVADTIESLIADGRCLEGGIGVYEDQNFCHYDYRGIKARW